MATKKIYDACVITGQYEKNGQQKNKYHTIGVVLETDGTKYMLLDRFFNPAGIKSKNDESRILVSLFEPQQNSNSNQTPDDDDRFNFRT